MENKKDEIMSVTINERDCLPTVLKLVAVFKEEETPELVAYVCLKILIEKLEQDLDIRGVTVNDTIEN